MTFWTNSIWGVRVFIWAFLLMAVILFIGVCLYFFREKIKEKYIKIRWPEKVIKCVIHYPGSQYFKEYWRLIPDKEDINIGGKVYIFSDIALLNKNVVWAYNKDNALKVDIDDKTYNLDKNYRIKDKGARWPEIHYVYNVPNPVDFYNIDNSTIKFTSKELETFKENDLIQKLLTLQGEKSMLMFLMILGIVNIFGTLFIISKLMGWIK